MTKVAVYGPSAKLFHSRENSDAFSPKCSFSQVAEKTRLESGSTLPPASLTGITADRPPNILVIRMTPTGLTCTVPLFSKSTENTAGNEVPSDFTENPSSEPFSTTPPETCKRTMGPVDPPTPREPGAAESSIGLVESRRPA